jgi:SAM-dependent methyltransferase
MPRPFAQHYDTIYADKDYAADVAIVLKATGLPKGRGSRLLELGAGTGSHSRLLAREVDELVSVEIDSDFAEIAEGKLSGLDLRNVVIENRPLAEIPHQRFDAACALFHVLNYVTPAEMDGLVRDLALRLKPGGVFVADLWNADAVRNDPPKHEVRHKRVGDVVVNQRIDPKVDDLGNRVTLSYEIEISGGGVAVKLDEILKLAMWSQPELTRRFAAGGFGNVRYYDYARFPAAARPDSWRVWMTAERISH